MPCVLPFLARHGAAFALLVCTFTAYGQVGGQQHAKPLNPSSYPQHLHAHKGSLYFVADDGIHGREIWRFTPGKGADENADCALAVDLSPGQDSSNPEGFFSAGAALYFTAEVSRTKRQPFLLGKDGDHASVITLSEGKRAFNPHFHGCNNGNIYMTASNYRDERSLYLLFPNGSVSEWLEHLGIDQGGETRQTTIGNDGSLYYYLSDNFIRFSEEQHLTLANSAPVNDLSKSGALAPLGDDVIFIGYDEKHGRELWRTDGTPEGTRLLKDVAQGPASARITSFCLWHDELYFGADNGLCGKELWKTDGTAQGTVLVKDIFEGLSDGNPHYFGASEKWLFYLAHDGKHGKELWRTDGKTENTVLVADLTPGPLGSDPWQLTPFKGELYFCASSAVYGEELFVSDGTTPGTRVLKDIIPGKADAGPDNLTVLDDQLFFTCNDGIHGEELWMTDGTPESTRLAADVYPIRMNPSASPQNLVAVGDHLFFTVHTQLTGEELWTSDGTFEGTHLVCDIAPGPRSSSPGNLTALENQLFFTACTRDHGIELWSSDGTPEGTRLVKDIRQGTRGSFPHHLCAYGKSLFFAADDGNNGDAVWRHFLPTASTSISKNPVNNTVEIASIFRLFDTVYIHVRDIAGEISLCHVKNQQKAYTLVREDESVATPFTFSSFPAGKKSIGALASRVFPPGFKNATGSVLYTGGMLLCVLQLPGYGSELCRLDRDPLALRVVCDIFPGPASSSPSHLCEAGGYVYFVAEHPTEGRTLWKTDGTAAGTGIVMGQNLSVVPFSIPAYALASLENTLIVVSEAAQPVILKHEDMELRFIPLDVPLENDRIFNIRIGNQGSWPKQLTPAGKRVFFTANDGIHGEELWVTDGTPQGTHLVKDILVPGDLSPLAS